MRTNNYLFRISMFFLVFFLLLMFLGALDALFDALFGDLYKRLKETPYSSVGCCD